MSTTTRAFKQVDVFTADALKGNPVAVILDAEGLTAADMQAIASWTNLSETTFVIPATDGQADYAVRIFTPKSELPFAGHPTLGTAHAVIEAGLATPSDGTLVQQCAVGLVEVSVAGTGLSFRLPRYAFEEAPEPERLVAALGDAAIVGAPRIVDVGPRWVIVQLSSAAAVERLQPDLPALADYDRAYATTGLTVFGERADGGIVVRSFAPADGVPEDPVCGSGNGAVAAYRLKSGQIAAGSAYTASQGRQVGRDGHVRVAIVGDAVHVGGDCVTVVDGTFRI
ncbi:PhzF family phenazine biosynthesis protein [Sphingorhabdus sp.]|uniref:PhzF family phenazine biosynthesis protein n=1 Tax=Sphingorhabdus sp. TaxID=1902408 RepID=UPI0035B45806|nr:PhzF family phenazine biosynthesis protein [Sphingomonadaceae bacterium]